MSVLKIKARTRFRPEPDINVKHLMTLEAEQEIESTGNEKTGPGKGKDVQWLEGIHEDDSGTQIKGWVEKDAVDIADATLDGVDKAGFVLQSILVEREFNDIPATAPWLVSANFLIARAVFETDVTNVGSKIPGSDGIGPLQVSTQEWKLLADEGKAYGEFKDTQRKQPLTQIYGAAFLMHHDAKAITKIKQDKGVGSDTDPFVPSLLDVFNAYLTGSPAAAVALIDAQATDDGKKKKIDEVLKGVIADDKITAFLTARSQFTGAAGQTKTVGDYTAAVEAALNENLKKAFELMKEHALEELAPPKQGEASWFDVAEEEEKKKIDEHNPAQKDIILDYFEATDLGRPKAILPWCGAFAAHCMAASNNPVPTGAAAAKNWKSWGVELPLGSTDVPRGAVVVLSPSEGTGSTGHVGFFVQFLEDGKKVELLGGNQGDQLKRTPFQASKIAAIRWIDAAPATSGEQFSSNSSQTKISQDAFDLIVATEVSSKAVYEKKYRGPIWPGFQSGVTMGIGYDIGQTKNTQLIKDDWKGVVTDDHEMNAILSAVGVTGPAARQRAQDLKGKIDIPFDDAIKVHAERVIPRWVGIVERALGPNTELLGPDCLGALVSLTYNRGPSFSKSGERYREMRAIKECVANKQFDQIPAQFRSMKRLWPSTSGLPGRRDREAQMFEKGLPQIKKN